MIFVHLLLLLNVGKYLQLTDNVIFFLLIGKDWTEKLKNGKMVKNDRINDCKWLILALKDTWHYEKYWENTLIIVQLVFLFLRGLEESKWMSKNAKFSKLETLVFYIIKIQV